MVFYINLPDFFPCFNRDGRVAEFGKDSTFEVATHKGWFFVDEQLGYSCRGFGGPIDSIQKTTDGGLSWTAYSIDTGIVNSVIEDLVFVSEDKGFMGGWYNPSFSRTTGDATHWEEVDVLVDTNANHLLEKAIVDFEIRASMPYSYYACGWYGEIYKSIDGGLHWFYLNSGTEENLRSIFFLDDNLGWVVGDNGLIIKTTIGGVTANISPVKKTFSLFPNPVEDMLYLYLPADEMVRKVQISTLSGQLVTIFENQSAKMDVHFLPKGSYWVTVYTRSSEYSQMIIKR